MQFLTLTLTILGFVDQVGFFFWQQDMANVGRSSHLVLGQQKGANGGEKPWPISFTHVSFIILLL